MAKMIFISFLKPSDFQHEYRLKKASPDEYMSTEYFRSIHRCPESEEKKQFIEKFFLAEAQRFQRNILSNNPETIVNALKEINDSPILTMGDTYTNDTLAAMGKILTHQDPTVRKAVCKLLSDYRTPSLSPEIMQNLLLLIEDPSSDVQTAAKEAVRMHGNDAVTYFKSSILSLLSRPETGMQKIAVEAIFRYSEHQRSERNREGGDPDIISPLRKLLYQSTDEEQIKTLLSTLGNLGYEEYFQDLENFYTHPNPRIQENVITMMRFEISLSERKKALPYFVQSLQSPDNNVRYAAVAGIDRLGDKSQIDCLKNLLKTEKQISLQKFIKKTISRLDKKK
jgi:HEAT repeat protein